MLSLGLYTQHFIVIGTYERAQEDRVFVTGKPFLTCPKYITKAKRLVSYNNTNW
jgi:hypothetical protein